MWVEKTEEVGRRIKERRTPTRPEEATREKRYRIVCFFFSAKGHASVFRKVFLPPMHQSVYRKHGSFCLQKQKCFIIKGLLLTQNLNSNSYCKLLLPDIVWLHRVPKFPTLLPNRKRHKKCLEGCSHCWLTCCVLNCCLNLTSQVITSHYCQ